MKHLYKEKLEKVSRDLLTNHKDLVTELIGKSHGIYALYSEEELYYVGKAVELKRRLKDHLKNKHKAEWTHFSLFLIEDVEYVETIESLLISIASPRGNSNNPRAGSDDKLRKTLKKMLVAKQKREVEELLGKKKVNEQKEQITNPVLEGLFKAPRPLFKNYKGVDYKAKLLPNGKIEYEGQLFDTPTGAAMKIVDRSTVNGWTFWSIQDDDNNWVKLKYLK